MDTGPGSTAAERPPLVVDTTEWSLFHLKGKRSPLSAGWASLTAILVTYVPLVIVVKCTGDHGNPAFFHDPHPFVLFVLTLPVMVFLAVTDDREFGEALGRIQTDGILSVPGGEATELLQSRWRVRARRWNLVSTGLAVLIGAGGTWAVHWVFARDSKCEFWGALHGEFLPAGGVFLVGNFIVVTIVSLYSSRAFWISILLFDIVRKSDLNLLPGHPDGCGGLRPIGRLGLRNQLALSAFGVHVAVLGLVFKYLFNVDFMDPGNPIVELFIGIMIAYVLAALSFFLGPLLAVRSGMQRAKARLMSEVATGLGVELRRIREQLPAGKITKDDEEGVERLRKLGALIEQLPVWPFDAATLRRIAAVFLFPLVSNRLVDYLFYLFKAL